MPPSRPRKLQRALDTIELYGGIMGVKSVAEEFGVAASNLDALGEGRRPEAWARIDCGRVYLKHDVEAAKARRASREARG
jgi:hypothetical protein